MLVVEVKGQDTEEAKAQRHFLEWVKGVNGHGGFGHWEWDVSFDPNDLAGILAEHVRAGPGE